MRAENRVYSSKWTVSRFYAILSVNNTYKMSVPLMGARFSKPRALHVSFKAQHVKPSVTAQNRP